MADKIKDLVTFQENLNSRCSKILRQTEYSMFSDSSQDSTISLGYTRYVPDSRFLSKSWDRPWYFSGTDEISDQEVKEVTTCLESGGAYATHSEPVR